jgi:hypothetical protein
LAIEQSNRREEILTPDDGLILTAKHLKRQARRGIHPLRK